MGRQRGWLATRVDRMLHETFVGHCVVRFDEIDGGDRAAVLALNAVLGLVPLAILGFAFARRSGVSSIAYADGVVSIMHIHGHTAALTRAAFASADRSLRAATLVGLIGLAWTAFGFSGALFRVYDRAWRLHTHPGPGNWLRGVAWLALFGATVGAGALARSAAVAVVPEAVASASLHLGFHFGLWLLTPSLLLGRRLPWRSVVLGAAVMSIGTTVALGASVLVVPDLIDTYAAPFGSIGVAVALGFWFLAIAYLWVAGAVVTAVLAEQSSGEEESCAGPAEGDDCGLA
jgi:membrane protein